MNPHDEKGIRYGLFIKDHLPAVLANDVVGKVTSVGSGVSGFEPGDRVMSQGNTPAGANGGGLQEYCIFLARYSCKVPPRISDDEAATLPVNFLAPFVALFDKAGFGFPPPFSTESSSFDYRSVTLLIIGGGSNCGKFAIQLAKMVGIGRIIVVASKSSENELVSMGATHVVDRHGSQDAVLAEIYKLTGDDLIYAYDTINTGTALTFGARALSTSKKGILVKQTAGEVDASQLQDKKAGYEVKMFSALSPWFPDLAEKVWKALPGWLEDGRVKPLSYEVIHGLDAARVNEVYDNYRDGKPQRKVHVHP